LPVSSRSCCAASRATAIPDFFFGAVARGAEPDVRRRGAAFFAGPSELFALSDVAPVLFVVALFVVVLFLGRLLEPVFLVVAMVIPPGVPAGCG
jgi:hypothetical protein